MAKARYMALAALGTFILTASAQAADEAALSTAVADDTVESHATETNLKTADHGIAASPQDQPSDVITDVVAVDISKSADVICVKEIRLGSKIPRRMCFTQRELVEERLEARRRWNEFADGSSTMTY